MKGILGGSIPVAASDVARLWDNFYLFLFWVCIFFFVLVTGAMIVFAVKYRKRANRHSSYISHNAALETIWTVIPLVLVLGIFAWGWVVYRDMAVQVPSDAMEIKVVAQRWSWAFQYNDGRTLVNKVYVPANKPVKFLMTSKQDDVIHSLFIPNLRVKKDVVPGMYTHVWFKADIVGQYQIFCTEYCGTGHSDMAATLVVLDDESWKLWQWGKEVKLPEAVGYLKDVTMKVELAAAPSEAKTDAAAGGAVSLVDQGKKLVESKGCLACHSVDGSPRIGPTWKGGFGREVILRDGSKVMADENYFRESIISPQTKIVKGFENAMMPPYAGQLNETELNAVIEYLKSLK